MLEPNVDDAIAARAHGYRCAEISQAHDGDAAVVVDVLADECPGGWGAGDMRRLGADVVAVRGANAVDGRGRRGSPQGHREGSPLLVARSCP